MAWNIFCFFLSFRLKLLSLEKWQIIKKKIDEFPINIDFSSINPEALFEIMLLDKKTIKGDPFFILLNDIGCVFMKNDNVSHKVSKKVVINILHDLSKGKMCIAR